MITEQPPIRHVGLPALAGLLGFLLASFSASIMGGFFQPGEWYFNLNQPVFTPPGWLFAVVWTILYILIAISGWLIWRRVGWRSSLVGLWVVQLVLNALWPLLFFGLHWMGLALINLVALWVAIAACVVRFRPVSGPAAWLLIPYLAWATFAFALNLGFWWLN